MSAYEEVAQSLKQVEQYTTQLREYATQLQQLETEVQQYENMVTNTLAPVANVWDQATSTMNKLRGLTDTLNRYKNQVGSIDAYLSKFQNTSTYRSSPCYSGTTAGCSAQELAKLNDSVLARSEMQLNSTKALLKGADSEQDAIEADAAQLEKLQAAAQGAEGHLQALGYANQLASHQANELLHLRSILNTQGIVIAARNTALADQEAQQAAAHEASTSSNAIPDTLSNNHKRW